MCQSGIALLECLDVALMLDLALEQQPDARIGFVEAVFQVVDESVELGYGLRLLVILANLLDKQFEQVDAAQLTQIFLGRCVRPSRRRGCIFLPKGNHLFDSYQARWPPTAP